MWSPGIAALISQLLHRRTIRGLGWGWGKTKYQLWSYAIPFLYTLAAYLIVWVSELGGFFDEEFVSGTAAESLSRFGLSLESPYLIIVVDVLIVGTL